MKFDVKHLWKTKKKWIIGITAGVTAVAVGCGGNRSGSGSMVYNLLHG